MIEQSQYNVWSIVTRFLSAFLFSSKPFFLLIKEQIAERI